MRIDCPAFVGTWICNICTRTGRDFRYLFCGLYFPQKGRVARCSRSVGENPQTPLQSSTDALDTCLKGGSGEFPRCAQRSKRSSHLGGIS